MPLELIVGFLYFNVMTSLIFYIHHYTVFKYIADVSLLKGSFILAAKWVPKILYSFFDYFISIRLTDIEILFEFMSYVFPNEN